MKKFAFVYASKYGQTRKIIEHMAMRARERGHHVDLIEISGRNPYPALDPDTDSLVIGAPVIIGAFSKHLVRWARLHRGNWGFDTKAFFTVSLNAADGHAQARAADRELILKLVRETGFEPDFTASLKGALNYREYGLVLRWLMKSISRKAGGPTDTSRNHELTDWDQVDDFIDAVVKGTSPHLPTAQAEDSQETSTI